MYTVKIDREEVGAISYTLLWDGAVCAKVILPGHLVNDKTPDLMREMFDRILEGARHA